MDHASTPQQGTSNQQTYTTTHPHPPQPHQRVVAHVEIPVHRPNEVHADDDTIVVRPPKRRKSNEGQAVPTHPMAPQKRVQSLTQQMPPSSSPLTELNSSQLPPTPQPNMDHMSMLLSLADEYTNAAYSMSTAVASGSASDEQSEQYYELLATAMGCLESALAKFRQPDPRREARIRLRLASLLVEETENDQEAEDVFSKGIALCERNRLTDLKYAMQHLSARFLFKRNQKAALKAIDKLVQEVEVLRLSHWTYTFRFLRVSLSLQQDRHSGGAMTLKHLAALSNMAHEERCIAVEIVAATLESIVHLRSGSADAADLAQRAMATARTHQLGPEMKKMPQIRGLLDCLDLTCSLTQFNLSQTGTKMEQMQNNLDTGTRDPGWNKDGTFAVELGAYANEDLEQDTGAIMKRSTGGQAVLIMRWITNGQLYALGYLLSGLATMYKNHGDGKAEQFLNEGLKMTKVAPHPVSQSLTAATLQFEQQQSLIMPVRLYTVFASCGRFEWEAAQQGISRIRIDFAKAGSEIDDDTARILLYLEAVCRQGSGDLRGALELYNSPHLTFEQDSKASNVEKDLRVLATMNSIFIFRAMGPEETVKADDLLAAVEQYCLHHANKAIYAMLYIAKATAPGPNSTMIKTKQIIQQAVQAAKEASNNQLLCILMNVMTDLFFRTTIVGDQAEKSSQAGRTLAKKGRDRVWTCVADGMYGDIMERCGKAKEAAAARKEAAEFYPTLPESLRNQL